MKRQARREGWAEGKIEGKIEGIKEGEHRGKLEVATKLLHRGIMTLPEISDVTGLSLGRCHSCKKKEKPLQSENR